MNNVRMFVDNIKNLVIPIPLFLYMERVIYDEDFGEKIQNDDTNADKFNLLNIISKEKKYIFYKNGKSYTN